MYKISGKLVTANCDLLRQRYDFDSVKLTEITPDVDAIKSTEISIYSLWDKNISEGGTLELPHGITTEKELKNLGFVDIVSTENGIRARKYKIPYGEPGGYKGDFLSKYQLFYHTENAPYEESHYLMMYLPALDVVGYIMENETCSYSFREAHEEMPSGERDAQYYYYRSRSSDFMSLDQMENEIKNSFSDRCEIRKRADEAFLEWLTERRTNTTSDDAIILSNEEVEICAPAPHRIDVDLYHRLALRVKEMCKGDDSWGSSDNLRVCFENVEPDYISCINGVEIGAAIPFCGYCRKTCDPEHTPSPRPTQPLLHYCYTCYKYMCARCYSNKEEAFDNKDATGPLLQAFRCNFHHDLVQCVGHLLFSCSVCEKIIPYMAAKYTNDEHDYDCCIECYSKGDNLQNAPSDLDLTYVPVDDLSFGSLRDWYIIVQTQAHYGDAILCNLNPDSPYYGRFGFLAFDDHSRSGYYLAPDTDFDKLLQEYYAGQSNKDEEQATVNGPYEYRIINMMEKRGMITNYEGYGFRGFDDGAFVYDSY